MSVYTAYRDRGAHGRAKDHTGVVAAVTQLPEVEREGRTVPGARWLYCHPVATVLVVTVCSVAAAAVLLWTDDATGRGPLALLLLPFALWWRLRIQARHLDDWQEASAQDRRTVAREHADEQAPFVGRYLRGRVISLLVLLVVVAVVVTARLTGG